MGCAFYHQLQSLVNVTFNCFKGFQESYSQPAASFTEPTLTSSQCNDTVSNRGWLSSSTFLDYLSQAEAQEIIQQFESTSRGDCQLVFWTGIPRERAQQWADARGMTTLTTLMGPLMETSNARCHRSSKGSKQLKDAGPRWDDTRLLERSASTSYCLECQFNIARCFSNSSTLLSFKIFENESSCSYRHLH